MNTSNPRYKDWLSQALEDKEWADDTFQDGRYPQCCFVCQQSAEKAMKAVAYFKGVTAIRGHAILEITKALGINDHIEKAAKFLDRFYISSRYPDAYPIGIPSEFIDEEEAKKALESLNLIIDFALKELPK